MRIFLAFMAILLIVWACKKLQNDSGSNPTSTLEKPIKPSLGYEKSTTDTIYDEEYEEDSTYTYIGYNDQEEIYVIYATRSNDTLYVEREFLEETLDTPRQEYLNLYATATLSEGVMYVTPKKANADIVLIPFDPSTNEGNTYALGGYGGTLQFTCYCTAGSCDPPVVVYGWRGWSMSCSSGCVGICNLVLEQVFQARPPGLIIDIGTNAETGVETIILVE